MSLTMEVTFYFFCFPGIFPLSVYLRALFSILTCRLQQRFPLVVHTQSRTNC